MANATKPRDLEGELISQISAIDRQIGDLMVQKETLQKLLLRVRRQNVGSADVTRKNSFDRIVAENEILSMLREAGEPLRTSDLLAGLKRVNPLINENTFRSHLHRLQAKGSIRAMGTRGYWKLAGPQ